MNSSQLASADIATLSRLRIGLGIDSHRLQGGGPLRLGGITIESDLEMIGHSDADVLLHAITDSICSAAMLPDIGELFPDNAAENKGRDSADFLVHAVQLARRGGYEIINLDCVVRMERPKLAPHKTAIRQRIASLLEISPEQIGLKAKTGEKTGDIGNSRLAEAYCTALMYRK